MSSDSVDTLAVRVSFTGGTPVLRRFLARLDAVSCPLLVRGIEVRPAAADGAAGGGLRSLERLFGETEAEEVEGEAAVAVPIVREVVCEFVVTVEYLDFEGPVRRREAGEKPEAGS